MSRSIRPHARVPASRPRRRLQIEASRALEERQLLAPVLATTPFTAATNPTNDNLGTVTITAGTGASQATSAAGLTSVAQLTPSSSFGGDIVRIKGGPGGDFGNAVYAISRGMGGNPNAIDKPGVIYRVDPVTGKTSIFFDLNTAL